MLCFVGGGNTTKTLYTRKGGMCKQSPCIGRTSIKKIGLISQAIHVQGRTVDVSFSLAHMICLRSFCVCGRVRAWARVFVSMFRPSPQTGLSKRSLIKQLMNNNFSPKAT